MIKLLMLIDVIIKILVIKKWDGNGGKMMKTLLHRTPKIPSNSHNTTHNLSSAAIAAQDHANLILKTIIS